MEKPQLRAVGKPRNVYNSPSKPLVLLQFFSPYIRFCCGLPTGTLLYRTSTRLPVGRSPIQSQPCGLVLRAFPSQLTVRPSSETVPLPILTSTPIASKTASNHHNNTSKATKTVLTVQYPSKTINKPLSGSYQTICTVRGWMATQYHSIHLELNMFNNTRHATQRWLPTRTNHNALRFTTYAYM